MSEGQGDPGPRGTPGAGRHGGSPAPNRAFQAILDVVPGAWFFTRRDGSFAYVNRGACEALGYGRDELLRCTIFDIDVTTTRERWTMLWTTTLEGDTRTIRVRHRRKDGSVFPVEVRAARILLDGEDSAVSYTVDLTANEQAELINRRLLAAIEQASDAVVMTDAGGRVDYVNPAYTRSTGTSAAEARGEPWPALETREDPEFAASLERVLDAGVAWQGRVRSRRRDGEQYVEEVSVSPIRDDEERVLGCVAVKRDITERLHMEQQLARTHRIEAVGQLARGIAHDFNNMLQVIQGQTHLIRRQQEGRHLAPMLAEIEDAAGRAAALVRQLLAFSRTGTIERSALRFDALVSSLHAMLRRLLGEEIQLEWQCSAEPIWVRGNAPQLEQVIVNLCINARDAMPGGGRLTLRLEPTELALPGGPPGTFVVLTVRDEGEGMSAEVQRRLFEPFFTTKPPGRGSGLGLATAQAIVNDHGGCIDVSSQPGQGSTFRVFLPAVEAGVAEPAHGREQAGVHGRGRLALVVEDESGVRELIVRCLEDAGFRVLAAGDGVEAEQLLTGAGAPRPAIAVLDAVMPRRGGQALYEWMRERGLDCPVVFVTGYDFESLGSVARARHVAILHKPFFADELLSQAAGVLGERVETA